MYGELMAIGMAFSFALSFIMTRSIEPDTTPLFNNTFRTVIGALNFIIISLVIGDLPLLLRLPPNLWIVLCMSILITVVLGDFVYLNAQAMIGPAYAMTITTTFPIFSALLEYFFLQRTIGWAVPASIVISTVGLMIVIKPKRNIGGGGRLKLSSKGVLLGLLAALFWAIGVVLTDYGARLSEEILQLGPNITFILFSLRFSFAAVILLVWSGLVKLRKNKKGAAPSAKKKSRKVWAISLLAAIIASTFGSYFYGEAARTVGATFLGIMNTTIPVIMVPLNCIINREKITFRGIVGILITLLGVLLLFTF